MTGTGTGVPASFPLWSSSDKVRAVLGFDQSATDFEHLFVHDRGGTSGYRSVSGPASSAHARTVLDGTDTACVPGPGPCQTGSAESLPAPPERRGLTSHPIGYRLGMVEHRLLPVLRGVRPRGAGRAGAAGGAGRLRGAVDLRPLPPVERRAGPEPVRLVRDRRAVAGDRRCRSPRRSPARPCGSTRRSSPRPRPPRGAARRPVRARRRHRRGAQRAHPRRRWPPRRRPAGDARGGRRGHARLLDRAAGQHHDGQHYTVENARLYTLPDAARADLRLRLRPQGRRSSPARIGDGFMHDQARRRAGRAVPRAGGGKPVQGGLKVCWGADEARRVETAHRLWPNERLPGELAQVLPTPAHFEQASQLVTADMVAEAVVCGPDLDAHVERVCAVRRRRLRRGLRQPDRTRPGGVLRVLVGGGGAEAAALIGSASPDRVDQFGADLLGHPVRGVQGQPVDDVDEAGADLGARPPRGVTRPRRTSRNTESSISPAMAFQSLLFRQPVQLGLQLTPAVQLEHRPVSLGRTVERDLRPHGLEWATASSSSVDSGRDLSTRAG